MQMIRCFVVALAAVSLAVTAFASGAEEGGGAGAIELHPVHFFDDFPDSFPEIPRPVDAESYAYDDMSESHDFEMMTYGYTVTPMPDNPITDYLNEQFNADITFTDVPGSELSNSVAVRFASGDPPDFFHLAGSGGKNAALTLFDQAQVMEVSGLLHYLPQARQYITKPYAKWATVGDEQMIGIVKYPIFQNNWGLFIRVDWLETFGMEKPQTEDEMFEFARASAFDDPDGNGEQDTWFMGGAGAGRHFGMLRELRSMFGHPRWNVQDGVANNPMLDGTTRDFLKFMNRLYSAKVLLPDWYTIDWNNFSAYSFNDKIGMVHYPGWNLMREYIDAQGGDLDRLAVWEALDPPSANDGRGGRYQPGQGPAGLHLLRAGLDQEPGKLKRILHVYDTLVYPNKNYWAASVGGGPEIWPDGSRVILKEDGTNIFERFRDVHPAYVDPARNPLQNWQTFGYTLLWEVFDDPMGIVGGMWNQYVNKLPRYFNHDIFITLDPEIDTKIREFETTNELEFVLGERSFDEWDAYVEEWKRAGGQELLEQVAEQLGAALP